MARVSLCVCPYCDAVYRRLALPARGRACCARCGSALYTGGPTPRQAWLALALTSAIAFLIANLNPIVELHLRSEHTHATLLGALLATWTAGAAPVATLVGLCAFVFPLLQIALELYLLIFLCARRRAPGLRFAMHTLRQIRPWSMVEVFMLGVVVAMVRLGSDTTVIAGVGLAGFMALTVLLTLLSGFDVESLWAEAGSTPP